jgi:7,8-dihydroneopterin aldolase/epimerase/oxygenase
MSDRIYLSELTIETIIGIFEWERTTKQKVSFDFEFPADARKAAQTDSIHDTLDYKKVAKTVIAYVESTEFGLIETLSERVAELILREFNIAWVKLSLSKPGAVRHSRTVGLTIERTRADYSLPA